MCPSKASGDILWTEKLYLRINAAATRLFHYQTHLYDFASYLKALFMSYIVIEVPASALEWSLMEFVFDGCLGGYKYGNKR